MGWQQYTPYIIPLLLGGMISIISAFFLLRYKPTLNHRTGAVLFIGSAIWMFAVVFELTNAEVQTIIFWSKIEYIGIVIVPVTFFISTILYSGYGKWVTRKRVVLLSIIPFITLVLAFTNELHGLIWRNLIPITVNFGTTLVYEYGAWFWLFSTYSYILLIISYIIIIRALISSFRFFRWQAIIMISVLSISLLANILHILKLDFITNFDTTPIAFSISSLVLIFGITRLKLGDITPVAHKTITESMKDAVIVLDDRNRIIYLNNIGNNLFKNNKNSEELIGHYINEILPDCSDYFESNFNSSEIVSDITLIKDEQKRNYNIQINPITYNACEKPSGKVVIIRDITERKSAEEKIKYLTFHDSLTGLYNRAYFEEELKRLDKKRQLPLCFIMGDINGLKLINDAFGHKEGDKLLKEIAKILKNCCRGEDIVSRWGGDEFSILLPKTSEEDSSEIIDRIRKACDKASTGSVPLSISLGVSTKYSTEQDIQKLIIKAEDRMYSRKLLESKSISSSIISSLERSLQEKNYETREHTIRLKNLALELGRSINLSSDNLDTLSLLATLQDIGKIAIPDEILNKKEKLTKKEWNIIKKHPEIGYRIALSSPQLVKIAEYILSHHENWDGTGYPRGLKGKIIPLLSRIIAIVDAYDVMIHNRPFKKDVSKKESIAELRRCSGTRFDPQLVEKFIQVLKN